MLPTSRTSRAIGLLSGTAVLVLGLCVVANPAAAADAGWNVIFRDDFSGTGLPDTNNWQFTLGSSYPGGPAQFGTGEVETNTNDPANVHEASGNLYITPIRDSAGNWTSARIETNRADFKAPAGGQMRVDARIAMPDVTGAAALGYWPAFWMLGSPYRADPWSWPGIGEFDIMENVQGIDENWATLHCGTWGGPCNEPTGISNGGVACPNTACQGNFHTYSFVWDRTGAVEQLRWYTDDQLTHTVSQSQVPADTWTQMTSHAGYFMILNVAVGGAFPDALRRRPVRGHPERCAHGGGLRAGGHSGRERIRNHHARPDRNYHLDGARHHRPADLDGPGPPRPRSRRRYPHRRRVPRPRAMPSRRRTCTSQGPRRPRSPSHGPAVRRRRTTSSAAGSGSPASPAPRSPTSGCSRTRHICTRCAVPG